MAESRAFRNALDAVEAFIKTAYQASFALRCIACRYMTTADQSSASTPRAFEFSLDVLLLLLKREADVDLAVQRISEKLKSLAINSVTSQESAASQHTTSSSSSTPSAQADVPFPSSGAASIDSVVVKASSTAPSLPHNAKSQQPAAPTAAPQSASTQPQGPLRPEDQPAISTHVLIATWTLVRGERPPSEITRLVGPYQDSSCTVLVLLIKHGGLNHNPALDQSRNGVPLVRNLNYYDLSGYTRSMVVQREISRDQNGCFINIPRITCHQYYDLYNSMLHIRPRGLRDILLELRAELQTAIVNRAAVHAWYEALPADDERAAHSFKHLYFLRVLRNLEHYIELAISKNRLQRIRFQ